MKGRNVIIIKTFTVSCSRGGVASSSLKAHTYLELLFTYFALNITLSKSYFTFLSTYYSYALSLCSPRSLFRLYNDSASYICV